MDLITIDFETYYDRVYSLTKSTTETYIRSHLFETIGVGVKINLNPAVWYSGDYEYIKGSLHTYDWANSIALAHNASFDAPILNWIYGICPPLWACTLSMARAMDNMEVGNSLKALAEKYKLGVKGTEVVNALGKHRADFTSGELKAYGEYCKNDCELTIRLFNYYMNRRNFPVTELHTISTTVKMFSEPVLDLNLEALESHLVTVRENKDKLMRACEANSEVLQSNPKFAALLGSLGVEPPTKISLRTKKQTFAFAKNDEGLRDLLDHPDERVQAVVAARLGVKSTLEETRTERLIGIAKRGLLPVPLKYYSARTGRWGGSDKLNLHNLPSRGNNTIKNAIIPPKDHYIINGDSSQIEARILAWLAGQNDLVEAFRRRKDVYVLMATKIYNTEALLISESQRFMGKTVVLGCGYQLGAEKFQAQLRAIGISLSLKECQVIIDAYRSANDRIVELWGQGKKCLEAIIKNQTSPFGVHKTAVYQGPEGFRLPNGFWLKYPELEKDGYSYTYKNKNAYTNIYGGKVVENLCQTIARCVIAEQINWIAELYKVALTVHDSIVAVVHKSELEKALVFIKEKMSTPPIWAPGLPLDCKVLYSNVSYGDCK